MDITVDVDILDTTQQQETGYTLKIIKILMERFKIIVEQIITTT